MKDLLRRLYEKVYGLICGTGTKLNIFHFQYLAVYRLHRLLKQTLSSREGDIIDVGCGEKPYKPWFKKFKSYIGVDIVKNKNVDVLVQEGYKIPLDDKFDVAICAQVLEHVQDLRIVDEIHGLLKNDGELILTVPFLYQIHDIYDFRRFTQKGIVDFLETRGFKVIHVKTIGGIGSTLGLLFLAWCECRLSKISRIISGCLLPLKLIMAFLINVLGLFFDSLDNTNKFYNGILIICKKISFSKRPAKIY
ncbi:Methyltransferase domain protein [uncultured archaeon]|nr:Methyltransferase domain protein [uncultured archaeon]